MVAAGLSKVLGTTAHSAMLQGFGPGFVPPVWKVRDGRTKTWVLWDNFYGDMLAVIGLNRTSVYDVPPVRPDASSLSAESYELWVGAANQFQSEGTLLFDIVINSLDLLGPHVDQDIRRIQKWKHDGVKDGRALVRWALSFVDRSTVEGQMALLTEINALYLPATETLFGLSEHLFKIWDLWLALSSSDRRAPNAFFSQLLRSLPSTPECPIVHVRRYLVELLDKDESQLLTDVDGDRGLFDKMIKYGKALGLQDKPLASLNYQQPPSAGGPPAKPGTPAGGGEDQVGERMLQLVRVHQIDPSHLPKLPHRLHLRPSLNGRPQRDQEHGQARVRQAAASVQQGQPEQVSQGGGLAGSRSGWCNFGWRKCCQAWWQARLHDHGRVGSGQQHERH